MPDHTKGPNAPRKARPLTPTPASPARGTARPPRPSSRLGLGWRAPAPAEADLRRQRRRLAVEAVVDAAELLEPPDRDLLVALYHEGRAATAVAAELAEPPRRVRDRAKRLLRRVRSHRFRWVVEHRDAWPPTRKRVATLCLIRGLPIREAALCMNVTTHTVRSQLRTLDHLFEQHEADQRRRRARLRQHLAELDSRPNTAPKPNPGARP